MAGQAAAALAAVAEMPEAIALRARPVKAALAGVLLYKGRAAAAAAVTMAAAAAKTVILAIREPAAAAAVQLRPREQILPLLPATVSPRVTTEILTAPPIARLQVMAALVELMQRATRA
jgi:hypothetical protein